MRSIIRIETQRLVLRTVTMSDISEVSKTWNLEKGDENRAVSLEKAKEAIEWMEDNHKNNEPRNLAHLCLAILRKDSEEIIGWCGLDGGYGQSQDKQKNIIFYLLLKKHWGKGYGTEAAIGILEYGFAAMKLDRIDGGCDSGNIGSKCIMEKIGMKLRECTTTSYEFYIVMDDYYAKESP